MEVLHRSAETQSWTRSSGAMEGLITAADSSGEALVLCEAPEGEIRELLAALRLFLRCGGTLQRLVVGSPHPTRDWIETLYTAGVERIVLTGTTEPGRPRANGVTIVREVRPQACPALHVWMSPQGPWSVCGERGDRLLVTERRMVQWCVGQWEDCPLRAASGRPEKPRTSAREAPAGVEGRDR